MLLNSVPKGSGFLKIKDMFGKPPVLSFLGHQADMDSSKSLITNAAIIFALLSLNAAINFENMCQGS